MIDKIKDFLKWVDVSFFFTTAKVVDKICSITGANSYKVSRWLFALAVIVSGADPRGRAFDRPLYLFFTLVGVLVCVLVIRDLHEMERQSRSHSDAVYLGTWAGMVWEWRGMYLFFAMLAPWRPSAWLFALASYSICWVNPGGKSIFRRALDRAKAWAGSIRIPSLAPSPA